jgi:hypothetical protein
MSDAWVGVIGTVAGTILGAMLALGTEALRARHEKGSRFMARRQELYSKYLAALLEWDSLMASAGRQVDASRTRLSPGLKTSILGHWDLLVDTYADLSLLAGPKVLKVAVEQGSLLVKAMGPGPDDFRAMVAGSREAGEALATLKAGFLMAARDELGTNID